MSLWRFEAIGTVWEIDSETPLPATLRTAVTSLIETFDAAWSRFRTDSLVSSLARAPGTMPAPPDAAAMLEVYAQLDAATDGAMNPLVGESLNALGYDAGYTLRAGTPIAAPREWRRMLHWNTATITLDRPALIDVGGVGKGRLVDRVFDLLPGAVTVDAGGDLRTRGRPLRVGLEHPYDPSRAIGVARVRDRALAASATTRRAWGDGLHHVLDARTGLPVRTIAATWAVAPDAMTADATAAALFFEGGPALAHRWGVDWVRMFTDGRVERAPGSGIELFTGQT